jgi:chromosome segregation ATPase
MLLFKPAPIYFLDEVEDALDLSYTQNVRVILKQHFKQSQFIIASPTSLKDSMSVSSHPILIGWISQVQTINSMYEKKLRYT